jgi:hypothetical protein
LLRANFAGGQILPGGQNLLGANFFKCFNAGGNFNHLNSSFKCNFLLLNNT